MRTLARTGILALITVVFSASALAQYSQPVRDVENPARTPFWGYASGTIGINVANVLLNVGTIPSGQRLVIEHVGVHCTADADDNMSVVYIYANKKTGPSAWTIYPAPLVVHKQGNNCIGKGSWTVSQPVRLYSDGGGDATCVSVYHSKIGATASCWTFVSGYTLSTP